METYIEHSKRCCVFLFIKPSKIGVKLKNKQKNLGIYSIMDCRFLKIGNNLNCLP